MRGGLQRAWIQCLLVLALFVLLGQAQGTSVSSVSSSSTSSSGSSSSLSSSRASPSPSSSPKPAWAQAPRVNLTKSVNSGLNEYSVTLNGSVPAYVANFSSIIEESETVSIIFNIEALGNDTSELPRVIVTTEDQPTYTVKKSKAEALSGGTATAGYNKRSGSSWEIVWDNGFGNWTYAIDKEWRTVTHDPVRPSMLIGRGLDENAYLDMSMIMGGNINVTFSVFVENTDAGSNFTTNQLDGRSPIVGDTTATEVLLFSALRGEDPIPQPTYPNYTLPAPQMVLPSWDSATLNTSADNFTFAVVETRFSPINSGLGNSAAAIVSAFELANERDGQPSEVEASGLQWMTIGHKAGFRQYEVLGGLKPSTNYTLWAVAADGAMSRPQWFTTKEESFACPLVLPTDLCPGVGYASPVAAKDGAAPLSAIPDPYAQLITENLANFGTSLTSGACGRDRYSFISTCLDCHEAYRDWLCRVVLPRCASNASVPFDSPSPSGPGFPYTIDRSAGPRSNGIEYPVPYVELQPCIAACTQVDRACPASLGFICPHRNFNANESYAFVGKNNGVGDGTAAAGWPALDRWGNRWCNY